MAEDQASYLEHLERWLGYEDKVDSPQLAEGALLAKPKLHVLPKRIDSVVEEGRKNVIRNAEEQHKCAGAGKGKYIPDKDDAVRLALGVPLPSCARDEDNEEYANGYVEEPVGGRVTTVKEKVKHALGF